MVALKRKFDDSSACLSPTTSDFKEKLPPELWIHIFSYLSSCREHIATCRCVCKDFASWSSEFLIQRVTFAKRFDRIQRLWEVLEHPYFSRCVTEFVYDASTYDESLATDFEDYEAACDGHTGRIFANHAAFLEQERYAQFYRRVCPHRPASGNMRDSEFQHEKGVHAGFLDYFRQWNEQKRIIDDGLDSDTVKQALLRLPNLRRIVFTDFREMARNEEDYDLFCTRTFGNTLEPYGLYFSYDVCYEFLLLITMIAETSTTTIQSLSVGGHPYESTVDFCRSVKRNTSRTYPGTHPPAISSNLDACCVSDDEYAMQQVCGKLRYLRLPICFSNSLLWADASLKTRLNGTVAERLLRYSAPGLVRLSLYASSLLQFGCDDMPRIKASRAHLEYLLFHLTFTSLQHLQLCGWPLPRLSFQDFLAKHSRVVKEVCLSGCIVFDDPIALGHWAGKNMFLSGVKIDKNTLRSSDKEEEEEEEKDGEGDDDDDDDDSDDDWSTSKAIDIEALWLDGRPNSLRSTAEAERGTKR